MINLWLSFDKSRSDNLTGQTRNNASVDHKFYELRDSSKEICETFGEAFGDEGFYDNFAKHGNEVEHLWGSSYMRHYLCNLLATELLPQN